MSIRIPCEHCSGSGKRDLTDIERNTRDAIGKQWASTAGIRGRLTAVQGYKTSANALVNRLHALRLRGLVDMKRLNGKELIWRTVVGGRDIRGEAIEIERWGRTMRGDR